MAFPNFELTAIRLFVSIKQTEKKKKKFLVSGWVLSQISSIQEINTENEFFRY